MYIGVATMCTTLNFVYCKIPIISPGVTFVQKAFFFDGLILEGGCYQEIMGGHFAFQK